MLVVSKKTLVVHRELVGETDKLKHLENACELNAAKERGNSERPAHSKSRSSDITRTLKRTRKSNAGTKTTHDSQTQPRGCSALAKQSENQRVKANPLLRAPDLILKSRQIRRTCLRNSRPQRTNIRGIVNSATLSTSKTNNRKRNPGAP